MILFLVLTVNKFAGDKYNKKHAIKKNIDRLKTKRYGFKKVLLQKSI